MGYDRILLEFGAVKTYDADPRRPGRRFDHRVHAPFAYCWSAHVESASCARLSLVRGGPPEPRGHEVTMMTVDAPTPTPTVPKDGPAQLETCHRNRLDCDRASAGVRTRLREADIVHLHVPWDPICWQIGRMARWAGVPYVITVHGMLDRWTMAQRPAKKQTYLRLFGRSLLEHAATVQCTARAEQEQSERGYPRGNSTVIR